MKKRMMSAKALSNCRPKIRMRMNGMALNNCFLRRAQNSSFRMRKNAKALNRFFCFHKNGMVYRKDLPAAAGLLHGAFADAVFLIAAGWSTLALHRFHGYCGISDWCIRCLIWAYCIPGSCTTEVFCLAASWVPG
jgi:hypothetical protein